MFSFWVQQYVSDLYLTVANWSATLFFFFHLLHILHIRLSFGIVHSIIIDSTISKITGRPREIGTGGPGVTSNHDNEAHWGSDSVFYSLISESYRLSDSSCARQRARSSTLIVFESLFPIRSHGEYYLKVPLRVLVESTSRVSPGPHTTSGDTPCKSQPAKSKISAG